MHTDYYQIINNLSYLSIMVYQLLLHLFHTCTFSPQTYLSYMKLMSKIAVGLPTGFPTGIHTPFGYFWRMMRTYILKPEFIVCGAVVIIVIFYLQAVDIWSRSLFEKIHYTLGKTSSKVINNISINHLILYGQ